MSQQSGYKRKREHEDDDVYSDDEQTFGRQILPVANLPIDFDGEPQDGLQYLFTVRRDARQLPHITHVENPFAVPELKAPIASKSDNSSASSSLLPSLEWRETFKAHFHRLRKNFVQPTVHIQHPDENSNKKSMPEKKERDLWWAFLAGRPESDWNPPKSSKKKSQQTSAKYSGSVSGRMRAFSEDNVSEIQAGDYDIADEVVSVPPPTETWRINDEGEVELALIEDPSESLPTPSSTPVTTQTPGIHPDYVTAGKSKEVQPQVYTPREPTPFLIKQIDHRVAIHLLMYFTHWINLHLQQTRPPSTRPPESYARWIFCLLMRVEEHVSADDMHLLRNLARACLQLISALHKARMIGDPLGEVVPDVDINGINLLKERSCWMAVTAVAEIWGQRDLWMDAEEGLKA